jgi:hypothetical protein
MPGNTYSKKHNPTDRTAKNVLLRSTNYAGLP